MYRKSCPKCSFNNTKKTVRRIISKDTFVLSAVMFLVITDEDL